MASQTICFAFFAIFALTISSSAAVLCNPRCPKIYQPVCAEDNSGHKRTFNNLCLMEYEGCMNRFDGWRFVKEGECGKSELGTIDTCPLICPLIYAPVCGINNYGVQRTFDNKCLLEATQCTDRAAGWKVFSENQCGGVNAVECPKFCTYEYKPICGQDQTGNTKTFANLCSFKMEQCGNRDAGWKVIAESECFTPYAEKPKCSNVCTDDYTPVCGVSNTGVFKTFDNKCMFEMEGCNNRDAGWKLLSQGVCNIKQELSDDEDARACQGICTREYFPICGQDNTGNLRTFANKCVFKHEQCNNRDAGWKVYKFGECNRPVPNVLFNCPLFCPQIYAPVEAVNTLGERKVFSNKCEYNAAKCLHPTQNWQLIDA